MEISIKNEGDTWLSFRIFKYWLKFSDRRTIESAACAYVCASLHLGVPMWYNGVCKAGQMCATVKCYGLFTELIFYKYHKECNFFLSLAAFVADFTFHKIFAVSHVL